jgi:hypothetical protein
LLEAVAVVDSVAVVVVRVDIERQPQLVLHLILHTLLLLVEEVLVVI